MKLIINFFNFILILFNVNYFFILKNYGRFWYLMLFIIKYYGLILIFGFEVLIVRGGEIIFILFNLRNNFWFEISINEFKR